MALEQTGKVEVAHFDEVGASSCEREEDGPVDGKEHGGLPFVQTSDKLSIEECKVEGVVKEVNEESQEDNKEGSMIFDHRTSKVSDVVSTADGVLPSQSEDEVEKKTIRVVDLVSTGWASPQIACLDNEKKLPDGEAKPALTGVQDGMLVSTQSPDSFVKEEWLDDVNISAKSEGADGEKFVTEQLDDAKGVVDKVPVRTGMDVDQDFEQAALVSIEQGISTDYKHTPFFCHVCDYSAASYERLMAHVQDHILDERPSHSDKRWNLCVKCDFKTNSKKSLQFHLSRADPNRFSCGICNYVTCCRNDLDSHLLNHQKIRSSRPNSGDSNLPAQFQCRLCRFSSGTLAGLRTHCKDAHKFTSCKYCSHACARKDMKAHMKEVHKVLRSELLQLRKTAEPSRKSMTHVCELCGHKTSLAHGIFQHLTRTHNVESTHAKLAMRPNTGWKGKGGKIVPGSNPMLTGDDI